MRVSGKEGNPRNGEYEEPEALASLLGILPGLTAIIGSGGKTTLMEYLADRLPGTVLLCTSAHIRRPARFPTLLEPSEAEVRGALGRFRAVCVGTAAEADKLTAPSLPFPLLASLADYVLAEADGSRGLPLKAHAPWEPVIPDNASRVVLVLGLGGTGRPVREVCHRPERYAALAGGGEAVLPDTIVTPDLAARVVAAEGLGDIVFLNQAENETAVRHGVSLAGRLAETWPVPVVCGSLWNGTFRRLR
ncbi:MAG: putative selenium-dependent hydroxylase accessory protein YqeC [Oscillibacter sp.]|nr:putative selenium-dependent hydroxylase accessory protein YqeC [Oscillibacter sp.]